MTNSKQVKRNYTPWTEQERAILKTAVQHNSLNGRINWATVQQYLPNRTKQQCKSIFMNLIKIQKPTEDTQADKSGTSNQEQDQGSSQQETQLSDQSSSITQSVESKKNQQTVVSKYIRLLTKHEQGTLYFISRYYNFDWETISKNYEGYTPKEIQYIHSLSHDQYTKFFTALRAFQQWDQTSSLDVLVQEAKDVYNEVVISLRKLEHLEQPFMFQDKDGINQERVNWCPNKIQKQLFKGETFQSLDYSTFDRYIIQRINEKYNLGKVYQNVLKWLEDHHITIPCTPMVGYESGNQLRNAESMQNQDNIQE